MPVYVFSTDDGEVVERMFPMGGCPRYVRINGKVAKRDRSRERMFCFVKGSKTPVKRGYGTWPMEPCTASGVQPWQAQELRDFHKKHGLNIEVTKDGDPIYTSAKQRKKALKARGMFDKASFD